MSEVTPAEQVEQLIMSAIEIAETELQRLLQIKIYRVIKSDFHISKLTIYDC